jgi:FixJ family two-component response regulator
VILYGTNVQLDPPVASAQMCSMANALPLIAVVDDDASVLRALIRLLRTRAFNAVPYASAREFLAALPNGSPDCLVLDLQMSEMTGLELLQHLKQKNLRIPTIVITAQGDGDMLDRCVSAGAIGVLKKPLQDTSLFAAIAAATRVP